MAGLNEAQVAQLLTPIKPKRVLSANGQSHVPAYDVAAHLTRILGFGNWETHLLDVTMLFESGEEKVGKNNKPYTAWTIGYAATIRLTIKDENGKEVAQWENGACGEAVNQPSRGDAHHLAMTTAISTAMKRCAAFGLGDQFGLSLYNKGSKEALVKTTLVGAPVTVDGDPVKGTALIDLESHILEPQSMGNDESEGAPQEPEPTEVQLTLPDDPIDFVHELREGLKASGLNSAEAKAFVDESLGKPLAPRKFSELTQPEARVTLALLKAKMQEAFDPTDEDR